MEESISTPVSGTKPSSDKLFKISIIIIGVLIVLGLFGNIYLLVRKQTPPVIQPTPAPIPTQILATPTINQTSGWKSYANQDYGFSINYPPYLISKEETALNEVRSVRFIYESEPTQIEFMIEKNFVGGWMGKKIKEEKTTVDGIEGNISLWLNCDSSIAAEWEKCNEQISVDKYDSTTLRGYFEKGKDKWYVSYKGWKKGEKIAEEEIQKLKIILSTFRFLD